MYVLHNRSNAELSNLTFPIDAPLEAIIEQTLRIQQADNNNDALTSFVCIVPTGRRVRLLKRQLTRLAFERTRRPVSDLNVFTLESFVRRCAELLLGNRTPRLMSDAAIAALMEEAADRSGKNLAFFTSGGAKFKRISAPLLERLQSIIIGLKEDGITPESLRADLAANGADITDANRLADIATLYEAYEQMLNSPLGAGLADYPKLLTLTVDTLTADGTASATTERWKTLFPNVQTLVVDGFTEFKKPEERFLAALYYTPFDSRIILDYSDRNGPLFGGLQDTIMNLQGLTGYALKDLQNAQKPETISLIPRFTAFSTDTIANDAFADRREEHLPRTSYLRRWLFNTEEDIRHTGFNDTFRIIAFENRADEVRSIVKLVRYFALREKIPLHDMCIVMRQPDEYASLFREMCALYDVPANITDRYPLEKSPVVTAVFAVLDMLLYGFRTSDVNRALQSPYVRFMRSERGQRSPAGRISNAPQPTPLNAPNLFTVAARLRIKGGRRFGRGGGGRAQWERRMESRLQYLSKRFLLLNADPNADRDELAETARFIGEIELAQRDFASLTQLFPNEETEFTPSAFNEFIKDNILARLRVHEQIRAFHDHAKMLQKTSTDDAYGMSSLQRMTEFLGIEEEVEKDARALTTFVDVLDEMTAILSDRDRREAALEHAIEPVASSGTGSSPQYERPRPLEEYIERLRTATRNARYQVREKLGYGVTVTSLEQIRGVPFCLTVICGAMDGEFPGRYVPQTFLGKELADSEERFLQRERIQFYQTLTNAPQYLEDGSKRLFITYPAFAENGEDLTRSSFVDALLKVTSLDEDSRVYDAQTIRRDVSKTVSSIGDNQQKKQREEPHNHPDWLCEMLLGLASEEEAVRAAALRYVNVRSVEERENVMTAMSAALTREDAQESLQRVRAYLDAKLGLPRVVIPGELPPELDVHVRAAGDSGGLAKSAYSISALEQYGKCPYQFFAARELQLREIQEFETSLSPLESGSLLHRILFKFYQELQQEVRKNQPNTIIKPLKAGLPELIPVSLDPKREPEYRELLHRIGEEEVGLIRFDHPFFDLDRDALLGITNSELPETAATQQQQADTTLANQLQRRGKLDVWLDSELRRVAGTESMEEGWMFTPALFELAFGEVQSQLGTIEIAPNLRLRGKIDRVELLTNEDGTTEFLIGDYKSGTSVSTNKDIENGISLQMPLYARATEEILASGYGIQAKPAGAVYYILSPKNTRENDATKEPITHSLVIVQQSSHLAAGEEVTRGAHKNLVESGEAARAMIDEAVQTASTYAERIADGEFPVAPTTKTGFIPCEYCDYKSVCRISELRSVPT
jgi:ATP-dependent helicase/DNAse subunit B